MRNFFKKDGTIKSVFGIPRLVLPKESFRGHTFYMTGALKTLKIFLLFLLPCTATANTSTDTLYSYQQLMQFFTDAMANSDAWRMAEVHQDFGDYYFKTNNYDDSFRSYKKSIDLFEKLGDSTNLYQVKRSLADLYIFQDLDDGAERLLQETIQFYNREKKGSELARAYLDLSRIYLDKNDLKKEIYYLNKSVDINRALKDTLLDITIFIEKSNSYLRLGEKNKALGTAERALALSNEIDNPALISKSLLALGSAFQLKKNPQLSIEYLRRSHQLTSNTDAPQFRDIYKTMAAAFADQENYDSAYVYVNKFVALNDSLQNASQLETANRLSRQYESQKKDEKIQELSQEKNSAEFSIRKQRNLLISALIGFLAILAGTYFIIRFFQKQISTRELINRQNGEINKQKITELENNMKIESMHAMIEGQEAERERVAKDLHDSLGGLLSTVKLQFDSLENKLEGVSKFKNYQNANRLLDTACQEVRDIARNMQPSSLVNLGLVAAVRDLINRIDDPDQRTIDFQHYGLENKLENTVALTVYRLVQELLNNSIKHSKAKEILIQLTREENEFIIMVEDDGVGFDVEGVEKGMGTENILSRVNYLKGDLSVHSEKGKGTTTLITVPL